MTCGIYMIQNIVNSKIYIGQSVNIEDRWGEHKRRLNGGYHINKHLQGSWKKYGQENFEFTIICECDESQLDTMEIDYIAKLKTYDPKVGYNKTYGGEGGRPTEETRKKISENHANFKGKNNPNYGKHLSEETRKKISENNGSHRPEVRKKMSESQKGRTLSEDHKKKLSENHANFKGKNNPNYGKHLSEETKRKLSTPIVQIDPSTNKVVDVWGSSKDAERLGGFDQGNISKCCKGKYKTHKGYRWMYLKDWLKEHNKGIPKKLYFID